MIQQEIVTDKFVGAVFGCAITAIQIFEYGLAPAIHHIKHHHAIGLGRILGPQDDDIRRILHQPLGVFGCEFDIHHRLVARMRGVKREMRTPVHPLVNPGVAIDAAIENIAALGNVYFGDFGESCGIHKKAGAKQQCVVEELHHSRSPNILIHDQVTSTNCREPLGSRAAVGKYARMLLPHHRCFLRAAFFNNGPRSQEFATLTTNLRYYSITTPQ